MCHAKFNVFYFVESLVSCFVGTVMSSSKSVLRKSKCSCPLNHNLTQVNGSSVRTKIVFKDEIKKNIFDKYGLVDHFIPKSSFDPLPVIRCWMCSIQLISLHYTMKQLKEIKIHKEIFEFCKICLENKLYAKQSSLLYQNLCAFCSNCAKKTIKPTNIHNMLGMDKIN